MGLEYENSDYVDEAAYHDPTYEDLTYDELLAKFRNEVKEFEFIRKREIILALAKKLDDAGVERETICEKLTEDLRGYGFHGRYIREVLPDEYKQKNKARDQQPKEQEVELSATTDGQTESSIDTSDPSPYHANYDQEVKSLYESSQHVEHKTEQSPAIVSLSNQLAAKEAQIEEQNLLIGKLNEQLTEQKKQVEELVKGVNNLGNTKQNNDVRESAVYKALESETEWLREQVNELKQIASLSVKTNPTVGFQNAGDLKSDDQPQTLEFDAKELHRFFMDSRNCKQIMYLKVDGNKIVGWESDAQKQKQQNTSSA